MQNAPIILFVYNRPIHTLRTLEALAQNDLAQESELFIYSDASKKNSTNQEKEKVEQVRQVVKQQKWCLKVSIIEALVNKGLAKSISGGVTEVIKKYGKVIVLEDDIVPNKGFLKYMNNALELYKNDEKVFGISGGAFPTNKEVNMNTFFLPIMSSWGWATWQRAWQNIVFDASLLIQQLEKKNITVQQYNFGELPYYQMLTAQAEGKIDSWAVCSYATLVLNSAYFLFPKYSLIQNIGFDSSGTHSQSSDDIFFGNVLQKEYLEIDKIDVNTNNEGTKAVEKAFKKQFGQKSFLERLWGYFLRKVKAILN